MLRYRVCNARSFLGLAFVPDHWHSCCLDGDTCTYTCGGQRGKFKPSPLTVADDYEDDKGSLCLCVFAPPPPQSSLTLDTLTEMEKPGFACKHSECSTVECSGGRNAYVHMYMYTQHPLASDSSSSPPFAICAASFVPSGPRDDRALSKEMRWLPQIAAKGSAISSSQFAARSLVFRFQK